MEHRSVCLSLAHDASMFLYYVQDELEAHCVGSKASTLYPCLPPFYTMPTHCLPGKTHSHVSVLASLFLATGPLHMRVPLAESYFLMPFPDSNASLHPDSTERIHFLFCILKTQLDLVLLKKKTLSSIAVNGLFVLS